MKLAGKGLSVRIADGSVAEIDDSRISANRELPEQVRDKGRVIPPCDEFARLAFTPWRSVRDRRVGNGKIGLGRELQERGIEGKHLVAFGGGALGKNYDA